MKPTLILVLVVACGGTTGNSGSTQPLAHSLFVAHEGMLSSYEISTGNERPGAVTNVAGPTDLQVLDDGLVLVNVTARSEVLVLDPRTMLEKARLPSSTHGATRPVHSYISPLRNGKQYWLALNDGTAGNAATDGALFVDVAEGSSTRFQAAGEVGLGIGHHKATFSSTTERVVISNIADCNDVFSVYDYGNPKAITRLLKISAADLGWDGSSFLRTCDQTFQHGVPPSPHGCATSKVSGKAYCNLTGSGELVAVALDATPVTFSKIATGGSGAGYTKAHSAGRYIYSLQEEPREGKGGATCQIGQLVVVDASTDQVVKQVPLLYKGPGCTSALAGTDEQTAGPAHLMLSNDGKTLFVGLEGGFGVSTARVRQELAVNVTDPANPVQLASIPVGTSTGHHGDAISGDGKLLFVANNVDGTVTQIDAATRAVTRTITVHATPQTLGTFGTAEGPSAQTGPIH